MTGSRILGAVLAGGTSRRFGIDKCLAQLGGKTLLERVIERALPQVDALVVNTNSDIAALSGIERLADDWPGEGPLAGILTVMRHAEIHGFSHVASFACDTPFFPRDTVARLWAALYDTNAGYAAARCEDTVHRIFALWPVSHREALDTAFAAGARSMQSVENWLNPVWADFPPEGGPDGDPFFNINTPAGLETAGQWLARRT